MFFFFIFLNLNNYVTKNSTTICMGFFGFASNSFEVISISHVSLFMQNYANPNIKIQLVFLLIFSNNAG